MSIPKKLMGCRIYIDDIYFDCFEYRTSIENIDGAWKKLAEYFGSKTPQTEEEFKSRNGKVVWYRSY